MKIYLFNILPMPSNIVYLIYYPHSSLLLTSMKKEYSEYIIQSLLIIFHQQSIQEVQLAGKNPDVLSDLYLYKESQGPFRKYRTQIIDKNPLDIDLLYPPKKKSKNEKKEVTKIFNSEDLLEKKLRNDTILEHFGESEQPAVSQIIITVKKDLLN